ncbi:MAG: hypothetical protein ACRDJ9_16105 [Dehalococcoidia bacterium]
MSLVLGVGVVAVGAYLRRQVDIPTDWATFGVVALMALGFFAAILGLYAILREPEPADERAAVHQRAVEAAAWRATLPPLIGGGVMLAFFGLTDRWDNLANPVQSQVALFAGIFGALVGMLADRITRWDLIIVPVALIVALIAWGDRLPLDSSSMSQGEMIVLLVIAVLLIGIAINVPQIVRGRRAPQAS